MSAPGWYPDPSDPTAQRYFDGKSWTESRAPMPSQSAQPFQAGAPYQPGGPYQPGQPYGTGSPPKQAVIAGLLQIFLGSLGIGRFYIGDNVLGGIQLALGVVGMFLFVFCFLGIFILIPLWIWTLIDAIMMFNGQVRDSEGRQLV